MTQEKIKYKAAMSDLREVCPKKHLPLLSHVDRYTGELRREKASMARRIAELDRTIMSKEAEVKELRPLLRLHDEIAELRKAKAKLAKQRDQLRAVVNEWQEIDEDKSTFVKVKAKCLRCSLHFVLCTWSPEKHTAKTIVCPECGQRKGHFMIWKDVPAEELIYQLVPGATPLAEFRPPPFDSGSN